jgi:putative ABC transport system permease protein
MSVKRWLRVAQQRFRSLFHTSAVDQELANELAFHYDQLVAEFVDGGMTERDARLAARRAIGNMPLIEEQCRDTRTLTWLHDLRQDVIYAERMLRRTPGFTVVAVASLALGIGANTAILSVIDAVLRDPLPIPQEDRLVVLRTYPLDNPQQETHALVADYFAWRDENRSFDVIGAAMGHNADFGADVSGAPSEHLPGQSMTADAFAALGVRPLLGRVLTRDDEEASGDAPTRVVVISYGLWQGRFAGRSNIIGQQLRLDRINRTVVGVMPESFRYPNEGVTYWIPLRMDRSQFRNPQRFFVVTARLKPGVTIEQAQSDVDLVSARLARADPDHQAGWSVRVKPLREAMFGWTRQRLFTLEAAVALVLLVACANVAGLLLARGLVRGPEIALRSALGAGRGRIVRQLLTESVLLSLGGGLFGLVIAWVGIRALLTMNPPPGGVAIAGVNMNLRTLAATAVIAIATGLLYGLAPAVAHVRGSLTDSLKEPGNIGGARQPRFRSGLVAAQIAVTMVLLVGAGLLGKSFIAVISRDLQFDTDRLLTFEVHIPNSDYMRREGSFAGLPYFDIGSLPSRSFQRIEEGLRALPGVESVAGVSIPLLNSLVVPSVAISLTPAAPDVVNVNGLPASIAIGVGGSASHVDDRRNLTASYFLTTPKFFTSIKAPHMRGRDFDERDTTQSEWVAIVNESAAHRFWPGQDALGQALIIVSAPEERPRKVIGVVRDIPLTLEGEVRPVVYTPYLQQPSRFPSTGANMFGQMMFMVRATGDPMSLVPHIRRVVDQVDSERPLANVRTMDQRIASVVPQRGYFVFAIGAFALTATLLAAIGIYGVMAYSVAQRTREIGIRVALGAAAHEVAVLVGRRAMLIVTVGLAVGVGGALMAMQLIRSQLWGVTPTDPVTFGTVGVLFTIIALAAAFFPMRRAVRVDPTIALRCE